MGILLELQNPNDYTDIPSYAEFQHWADAVWQHTKPQEQQDCEQLVGVVLRIVDVDEGRLLNHSYRGKDDVTNVLSFPFADDLHEALRAEMETRPLGDIAICKDVVSQEAIAQGKTLTAHWAHLLVHGLLHLQGYDHVHNREAQIMETLEVHILTGLNFSDPYQ